MINLVGPWAAFWVVLAHTRCPAPAINNSVKPNQRNVAEAYDDAVARSSPTTANVHQVHDRNVSSRD
jgi:hypothetical protein